MSERVASHATGAIDAGAAIGSGWRFLVKRPGVVLLWALAIYPFALALLWFLSALFGGPLASGGLPGWAPLAALFLTAPLGVVVRAAAMRSVLQPDGDAFGYLRLGGREWSLATVGWTRSPDNLPFGAILGLLAVTLGLVVLNVLAAPFGPAAMLALNLAAAPLWLGLVIYLNMRGALAGVAAYSGVIDAQARAFERTRGQVGPLSAMVAGSRLGWLVLAGVLAPVWLWVQGAVGAAFPAEALPPGAPTPALAVGAIVVALAMAAYAALCVRPSAAAWLMLVGARRDRNFLAEVTG